jgi:hypothetical protein
MTSISHTTTKTPPSAPVSPAVAAANKTLKMLLLSNDVTQAISSQSSSYVPPTAKQMLSTLWALFDVNGANTINLKDVQQAVAAEGGKPSDANALWAQFSINKSGTVNAAQFIDNAYLVQGIASNLPAVQAAVKTIQQQAGPGTSNDLLGTFFGAGGSGSIISDVGGGNMRATLINILG